jgi:hypothetical protein
MNKNAETLNETQTPKLGISDIISSLLIKVQKMYGNRYDKFSIQMRSGELYVIGHEIVANEADWEHEVWLVKESLNYL